MPKLDQEIQRLIELSGKATQGEWTASPDFPWILDCNGYPKGQGGKLLCQFAVSPGYNEHLHRGVVWNRDFIAALVNFFRAHAPALLEAERELELLRAAHNLGWAHKKCPVCDADMMTDARPELKDAAIDSKLRGGES